MYKYNTGLRGVVKENRNRRVEKLGSFAPLFWTRFSQNLPITTNLPIPKKEYSQKSIPHILIKAVNPTNYYPFVQEMFKILFLNVVIKIKFYVQ